MFVPSYIQSGIILVFLTALAHGTHNLDYSDLQAMGLACPERDKCAGYRFNRNYMDRSCECDSACKDYKDCCIDSMHRRSSSRSVASTNTVCMNYGEHHHSGVYVVAHCNSNWDGPREVRQKCEGATDLTDPLRAAPVTSIAQAETYKNLFCAECNNVNLQTLKTFQFKLSCDGLYDLTQEQILADLVYNERTVGWGINRMNSDGVTNFIKCDIVFDVPSYINSSVRFCRANVVSRCPRNWTRTFVRSRCDEYMAVVYDNNNAAYRNPHCALCNHRTVADISCMTSLSARRRPMSFALLLDVNQSDGDQVGMTQAATPECSSGHKYDPFFKKCRKLVCALPGYQVVNGRCAPGGS